MTTVEATASMTRAEAEAVTVALLAAYGLDGWSVAFNNARRIAGSCEYSRKRITLSLPLIRQRSKADVLNTITHEIAHALTPGHRHDFVWQLKHRELGGDGQRCHEHFDADAPWVGTCGHGKKFARYRKPKTLHGWRCRCTRPGSPVTWARRDDDKINHSTKGIEK